MLSIMRKFVAGTALLVTVLFVHNAQAALAGDIHDLNTQATDSAMANGYVLSASDSTRSLEGRWR